MYAKWSPKAILKSRQSLNKLIYITSKNRLRKNTQEIKKLIPKTTILEPRLLPICPQVAANVTSCCDLALGACPWVAQGMISMVFGVGCWCHVGDILRPVLINSDQMPIDPTSYSPCLAKASHGHTSTRILKWGRRGREAL